MTDDKRKKKRGRKTKLNLRSCFPSFANESERPYYHHSNKSNDRDFNNKQRQLGKLITVTGCNKNDFITDVEFVNNDDVNIKNRDRDPSSHRRRILRLFKSALFDSFMVKKINRNSSKSSITSDSSESSSSLSSEKTIKSVNHNNAIRVREFTDFDSSLLSSSSRTTTSTNLSSSCCSSSTSNSQWSSEQKTSSRIDLPKPNHGKVKCPGNNQNTIRWCLFLLLSLVVLVVYGRIYSILCTSTWFYFVPCPSRKMKRVNSVSHNTVKVLDTDSEQYKKRVIMAGLLHKTRNSLR